MMPPTTMQPRELWLELSAVPRPNRVMPFPRKGADGKPICEVAFVPLTQDEHLRSSIEAEKLVRKELPDASLETSQGYRDAYSNAVAVYHLMFACREPHNIGKSFFPSPVELRRHLTADEIGALYNMYLEATSEIGPIIGSMTKEEAEAWINKLVEGVEQHDPLGLLGLRTCHQLLKCFISRCRKSPTDTPSAGSPADVIGSGSLSPRPGSGPGSSEPEDVIGGG